MSEGDAGTDKSVGAKSKDRAGQMGELECRAMEEEKGQATQAAVVASVGLRRPKEVVE